MSTGIVKVSVNSLAWKPHATFQDCLQRVGSFSLFSSVDVLRCDEAEAGTSNRPKLERIPARSKSKLLIFADIVDNYSNLNTYPKKHVTVTWKCNTACDLSIFEPLCTIAQNEGLDEVTT